ncbi:hypothetical protein F7734_07275 [Scytonema sp. UIC 10036]|uniref:hypothetical protein n=1 Tax=Scytonema sp. UIC 10036 TaxID=2304196 RepID=UPI0012DA35E4|nr:hypothetical protein [Scytonema sp. UIC 10036]MUG92267.1 hypothetical protein [Scytonema sp. UIC 10036]
MSKELAAPGFRYDWHADPMLDPYFRLPLWLQTKYRHHVLWAYNERHLLLLEQYIASLLRGSKPNPQYGWQNQSLFSRLPKWMIVSKHRPGLLKAIAFVLAILQKFQAKLCPSPLNCAKKASNLDALTTSPSTFPIRRTW